MDNYQFNELLPAEAERLYYLSEELGEAIQAIGKILRHGYNSHHPAEPPEQTNRRNLEKELRDVYTAILMMTTQGDLIEDNIFKLPTNPPWNYLHHQ